MSAKERAKAEEEAINRERKREVRFDQLGDSFRLASRGGLIYRWCPRRGNAR